MKIVYLVGAGIVAAGVWTSMAVVPAQASGQDGVIDAGEFAFFYNSHLQGSIADFKNGKADLSCCTFISSGAGQGQSVKNNAASVRNNNTVTARVYYNSSYLGVFDEVDPGTGRNLSNTYNDNASFKWL